MGFEQYIPLEDRNQNLKSSSEAASDHRFNNRMMRLIANVSKRDKIKEVPKANTQVKFSRSIRILPGKLLSDNPNRLIRKTIPPTMRKTIPKIMNIRDISTSDMQN